MFYGSSTMIVQPAVGQPEDPFPVPSNETLTPAQRTAREQLLKQEGFSVNVIARNLSAPLNILYGPDDTLWITERIGKNITRIDPINGTKLSSTSVPNVHQSAAQDGLLGMTFDPYFNNTHHIYVAYTYDADPVGNSIAAPKLLDSRTTRLLTPLASPWTSSADSRAAAIITLAA